MKIENIEQRLLLKNIVSQRMASQSMDLKLDISNWLGLKTLALHSTNFLLQMNELNNNNEP